MYESAVPLEVPARVLVTVAAWRHALRLLRDEVPICKRQIDPMGWN